MNYQGIEHSRVVQRNIGSVRTAEREFANTGTREIPIVLVPKSSKFLHFMVNVPSGPYVLHQRWLKNMGQLNPGVIWVWPFWNRISHVVTRATITYNAPAQNCPTADNGESTCSRTHTRKEHNGGSLYVSFCLCRALSRPEISFVFFLLTH